jgi:hypothetical protein
MAACLRLKDDPGYDAERGCKPVRCWCFWRAREHEATPPRKVRIADEEESVMTAEDAKELKALTDAIVQHLETIQSFGYDLNDLNEMAKASAQAVESLQELDQWGWSLDDIDDIGNKAAEVLTTLQELEEASGTKTAKTGTCRAMKGKRP